MLADLKRLMDEYKARINDPSYVAPKELRGTKQTPKPIAPSKDQPLDAENIKSKMQEVMGSPIGPSERLRMYAYAESLAKSQQEADIDDPNDTERARAYYNRPEKRVLVEKLGIKFAPDNMLDMTDEQNNEVNQARYVPDEKQTAKQKMIRELFKGLEEQEK